MGSGDEGKNHAVTGKPIHFPNVAVLEVKRLVISKDGWSAISLEYWCRYR